MRPFRNPALTGALLALLVGLASWSVDRYRHRFVRTHADLLRYLPAGDATLVFADVKAVRRSGYLTLLSGTRHDADYRDFMAQTGFDYSRDLDAMAAASNGSDWTVLAQGRFDWSRLRRYSSEHHGNVRLFEIQPDVLVLTSKSTAPARESAAPRMPSADAIWLRPAHTLLSDPAALPLTARMFAVAVQQNQDLILSLTPSSTGAAFDLKLRAEFVNDAAADTAARQLEIDTKLLKLELSREGAHASRSDLTGLFTAGAFSTVGHRVVGTWPVYQELVDALR